MPEYKFRCTKVTTVDYGDTPAAGITTTAQLARIPDGSHWQDFPQTIDIAVPEGTRPGAIWRLTLTGGE